MQSSRSSSLLSVSLQRRLELNAKARWCRHNPTTSEHLLWQALKSKQLGVSFRRQVVLLNRFIVDFYASQPRLIVEIDGGYHVERQRADARRDVLLQRAGYRVLRLSDECVTGQLALAIARIRERVQ